MQNLRVTKREHYGILWHFLEWSIAGARKEERTTKEWFQSRPLCASGQWKNKINALEFRHSAHRDNVVTLPHSEAVQDLRTGEADSRPCNSRSRS